MPSPVEVDCDETGEKNQRTGVGRCAESFQRQDRRATGFVSVRLRREVPGRGEQRRDILQEPQRIVSSRRSRRRIVRVRIRGQSRKARKYDSPESHLLVVYRTVKSKCLLPNRAPIGATAGVIASPPAAHPRKKGITIVSPTMEPGDLAPLRSVESVENKPNPGSENRSGDRNADIVKCLNGNLHIVPRISAISSCFTTCSPFANRFASSVDEMRIVNSVDPISTSAPSSRTPSVVTKVSL
jgi:hypothetical protein